MINAKQCAAKQIAIFKGNGFEIAENQEVYCDLKAVTVSMDHIGTIIKKVEIGKDATYILCSDNKEGGDVVVFRIKGNKIEYSTNIIPF